MKKLFLALVFILCFALKNFGQNTRMESLEQAWLELRAEMPKLENELFLDASDLEEMYLELSDKTSRTWHYQGDNILYFKQFSDIRLVFPDEKQALAAKDYYLDLFSKRQKSLKIKGLKVKWAKSFQIFGPSPEQMTFFKPDGLVYYNVVLVYKSYLCVWRFLALEDWPLVQLQVLLDSLENRLKKAF